MKRREFMALLGGVAAWPLAARAQQAVKRPTIGYLRSTTPSAQSPWTTPFVQGFARTWASQNDNCQGGAS